MRNTFLEKNLFSEVLISNFFVWKDVLYYDGYKRKVATDEVVVTDELLRVMGVELSIDEIKEDLIEYWASR